MVKAKSFRMLRFWRSTSPANRHRANAAAANGSRRLSYEFASTIALRFIFTACRSGALAFFDFITQTCARCAFGFTAYRNVEQEIYGLVVSHPRPFSESGHSGVSLFRHRKSLIHLCWHPFAFNLSSVYYRLQFMSMTFIDIPENIRYDIDCSGRNALTLIDTSVNRLTRYIENVGK